MQEFLLTETGYMVSIIALLIGLSDLIIGWWWMGRREAIKALQNSKGLQKVVPILLGFDLALVAIGLYGLRLHHAAQLPSL